MRERITNATKPALHLGRNIYLAGLGVVTTVTDQYTTTFSNLVEKGRAKTAKPTEEETAEKEAPKVVTMVKDLAAKTGDKVQDGVNNTLNRLGVPSKQEIRDLTSSIEKLTEKVQAMQASA